MALETKLSGPEQRLFLRLRSEQLRAEAIAATGDPQARSSQAPGMKGQVLDQLPGGTHAAEGKPTVDLLLGKHVARAKGDPQKPAGQSDRKARLRENETNNVSLVQKAQAQVARKETDGKKPKPPAEPEATGDNRKKPKPTPPAAEEEITV